jgi:ribose transport system permease protein/L-arabinose transport system permease protein
MDSSSVDQSRRLARPADQQPGLIKRITAIIGAENLSLMIALAIVIAVIASQSDAFFLARNLLNIGQNISVVGLVAIGVTIVIVSAGLDISVGSIAGVASVVSALMVTIVGTVIGGVVVGVAAGAVLGVVNAAVITFLRVNPVIATLATMSAFRGLAFLIAPEGRSIGVLDQDFVWLGVGRLLASENFPGIPVPLVILIGVALIAHFVLLYSVFGRSVYAMGGNPVAARLAGINLTRMKFMMYSASGALAGLAGVIVTARTSSGQPASGTQGLELEAITAVFLGGAILAGGKGTIAGTMLAVLLIGTLSNGMNLMGIPTFYQLVAEGLLLIVAVAIGQWRMVRSERIQARAIASTGDSK